MPTHALFHYLGEDYTVKMGSTRKCDFQSAGKQNLKVMHNAAPTEAFEQKSFNSVVQH